MTNVPLTWARLKEPENCESEDYGGIYSDKVVYEQVEGFNRAFRRDLAPGAAEWAEDNKCLIYVCPCGCGAVGAVPTNSGVKVEKAWLWDGNVEKPTLSPSILKTFGCRWHGYLRNGIWEQC